MKKTRSNTEKINSGSTVTRMDLAKKIYQEVGLSLNESSHLVEWFFEQIINQLENHEKVKISGFGSFGVNKKNERIGRNPKTGIEVPIEARCVVTFKASQSLKNRINTNLKLKAK